jgi:hypothetical protein
MEEELMVKANTKLPATLPAVDLDSAIARYETMPLERVERELHNAGIDPRPTIAAVKALVAKTLRHKRERRSVHGTAIVTPFLALLSWMALLSLARQP